MKAKRCYFPFRDIASLSGYRCIHASHYSHRQFSDRCGTLALVSFSERSNFESTACFGVFTAVQLRFSFRPRRSCTLCERPVNLLAWFELTSTYAS